MRQLFYNARVAGDTDIFDGYVVIQKDRIVKVGRGVPERDLFEGISEGGLHDLHGHFLMPGVIDSHVHFREPGLEYKADISSESRAAVAGGVTSFMEMPNTKPATVSPEALEDKFARAAKSSIVNYSFYVGATDDNVDYLRSIDFTRVPGVKLFMGSSTGGMLVNDRNALARVFSLPALVAVHCEDEATVRGNAERLRSLLSEDEKKNMSWHAEIRSVEACFRSTKTAIELAEKFGTRLHVMHLTTAEETELVRNASDSVTAEVCVAHLSFTDEDYSRLGALIKCNPAVKGSRHRLALQNGLLDDTIATVSTDHAPHARQEKDGDVFTAPSGMPFIQFSLVKMIHLAKQYGWPLGLVVKKMCHAQADTFGIDGRGYIREGYKADLVEVDTEGKTIVDESTILSKCGWSPCEGEILDARVINTWVNGRLVYNCKNGVTDEKCGEELRFKSR